VEKTFDLARQKQDGLFNEISYLLGALASPVRLKIIHFLSQSPHSVDQLSQKLGQSVANTSMHLKKMQRENILKTEIDGQKRIYSLAQTEMKDFWEEIQKFCLIHNPTNILSTTEIYGDEFSWTNDIEETIKFIKSGKIILIDVRPNDEIDNTDKTYERYVQHIPYSQLKKATSKMSKSKTILIICRGRLCVMSSESTHDLRNMGFKAFKLDLSWHTLSKLLI